MLRKCARATHTAVCLVSSHTWASSVHFIANSASAENGFNLFCRFFLRCHQMHLIREGLEVNLIKVMGVTFLNTLAIADHVCKTKYWVGGWEHWWEG